MPGPCRSRERRPPRLAGLRVHGQLGEDGVGVPPDRPSRCARRWRPECRAAGRSRAPRTGKRRAGRGTWRGRGGRLRRTRQPRHLRAEQPVDPIGGQPGHRPILVGHHQPVAPPCRARSYAAAVPWRPAPPLRTRHRVSFNCARAILGRSEKSAVRRPAFRPLVPHSPQNFDPASSVAPHLHTRRAGRWGTAFRAELGLGGSGRFALGDRRRVITLDPPHPP